jgi:hypothetical protein
VWTGACGCGYDGGVARGKEMSGQNTWIADKKLVEAPSSIGIEFMVEQQVVVLLVAAGAAADVVV